MTSDLAQLPADVIDILRRASDLGPPAHSVLERDAQTALDKYTITPTEPAVGEPTLANFGKGVRWALVYTDARGEQVVQAGRWANGLPIGQGSGRAISEVPWPDPLTVPFPTPNPESYGDTKEPND